MQPPNDKIAISQDTYDKLIASKHMAQLDALGIGTVKFRVQVEGLVQSGVRRDDAFKQILDMYVTVDSLLGQIEGIETDAQFIADWTAWAAERERAKPFEVMTINNGTLGTWTFYGYNDYREDGLRFKDDPDAR